MTIILQNTEKQNLESHSDGGNIFYKFRANSEEKLKNIDSLLMFSFIAPCSSRLHKNRITFLKM